MAGARPQAVQAGVGLVVREILERLEFVFRPPGERPQRLYVTTDPRVQRIFDLLKIPADALLIVLPLNSG